MTLHGRQVLSSFLLAVAAGATACRSGSVPVTQPVSRSQPAADSRLDIEPAPSGPLDLPQSLNRVDPEYLPRNTSPGSLPLRRGARASGQGFTVVFTDVRQTPRNLALAGILTNTGSTNLPVGALQLYLDNTPEVEKRKMNAYMAEHDGHSADITAGSKFEALVNTHVLTPGQNQPFRVKWGVFEHDLPSSPLKELVVHPQFTKTYQEPN